MKLLVVREVASIMRVSTEHIRRLIRTGHLPAFKVGRRGGYRIREEDLSKYIDDVSRCEPPSPGVVGGTHDGD
ncbi:MAG: helix-turn-helix domain-containing protein [Candidatus Omnitrophica bacterium]|nr:helix-turn-helix domain-containing protein [Candidatus Omnitrophota bacterium]